MSLTSFFRDTPDARHHVSDALRRPLSRPALSPALAPPRSKHYGLVGTAFDYLLRSLLVRAHTGQTLIHTGSPCLALLTIPDFSRSRQKLAVLREAYDLRTAFELGNIPLSPQVARACLILASFDVVIRVGRYHELAGLVEDADVEDLLKLAELIPFAEFRAKERLILNPHFHHGHRVFGADGDLLIDDLLVDVKVAQENKLRGEYLQQLTGYLALERLGGIVGAGGQPIRRLGIYFARHGILQTWAVAEIYKPGALPPLVTWLDEQWLPAAPDPVKRAAESQAVGRPEKQRSFLQIVLDTSRFDRRIVPPTAPTDEQPHVRSALVARRVGRALLGTSAAEDDVNLVAGLLASCPMIAAPLEYVRVCLNDVDRTWRVLSTSKHTDIWYVSTHKDLHKRCKRILARMEKALAEPLQGEEKAVLEKMLPVALPLDEHGNFSRLERSVVKRLVESGRVMQDGRTFLRLDMARCCLLEQAGEG